MKLQSGWRRVLWIFIVLSVIYTDLTSASRTQQIANCLKLTYKLINHNPRATINNIIFIHSYYASIKLKNICKAPITADGDWSLKFSHNNFIEFQYFDFHRTNDYAVQLSRGNMKLKYLSGHMFSLTPIKGEFQPIQPNAIHEIVFLARDDAPSRYAVSTTWEISDSTSTAAIPNTKDSRRDFVEPFNSVFQVARFVPSDDRLPLTPPLRYNITYPPIAESDYKPPFYIPGDTDILPVPFLQAVDLTKAKDIPFIASEWSIVWDNDMQAVKDFLSSAIQQLKTTTATGKIINMTKSDQKGNMIALPSPERYILNITAPDSIYLQAETEAGMFYAVQSLLRLLPEDMSSGKGTIRENYIEDAPRFPHREFMLDVASTYFPKTTILKVIRLMSMLKMNKLKLLMAKDEGVGIEIEGIPELGKIGKVRCEDFNDPVCISKLGGYLTKKDYVDIVKEAGKYYIEVIPMYKFDDNMLATVLALQKYAKRTNDRKYIWAELSEPLYKLNMFKKGKLNPCDKAAFTFLEKLIKTFVSYHTEAGYPLIKFDVGGEIGDMLGWKKACYPKGTDQVHPFVEQKKVFTQALINTAASYNVTISAYATLFTAFPTLCRVNCSADFYTPFSKRHYGKDRLPFIYHRDPNAIMLLPILNRARNDRTPVTQEPAFKFHTRHMAFQEEGYNSIYSISDKTNLHHKEEHDPDIPGDLNSGSAPIAATDIHLLRPDNPCCHSYVCHNNFYCRLVNSTQMPFTGMQFKMFTDNIETEDQLMFLLFPRLIWAANKMWHKSIWEYTFVQPEYDNRTQRFFTRIAPNINAMQWEYVVINAIITHKWLPILFNEGINFRVPPPGIMFNHTATATERVKFSSALPGFILQIWMNKKWTDINDYQVPYPVPKNKKYYFRLRSPLLKDSNQNIGVSHPVTVDPYKQSFTYEAEKADYVKDAAFHFPIEKYPGSSEDGIKSFRVLCSIPYTGDATTRCGPVGGQTAAAAPGTINPGAQSAPNQQQPQHTGQHQMHNMPQNSAQTVPLQGIPSQQLPQNTGQHQMHNIHQNPAQTVPQQGTPGQQLPLNTGQHQLHNIHQNQAQAAPQQGASSQQHAGQHNVHNAPQNPTKVN